ncbi:peptide-methionine (S)-S-oxide reductase [Marinilactibacillus sp. 15R]|uniref:Peptide methionine sulfoxide reductase MsrA n=1 Tax=Marinilactibacillus piezotolerans TaxID=258723 RepID=A0A1I3XPL2_9LACT|nr:MULTISPECIES: peptide-methionine (S)-S-oxide reductase MsrA [Marinilactibacillus]API88079.1 peptide-methionine (S)-S-oxide reductase [Marinilactibacillus sp. 15R]SFK21504.1 peptide-methionine (S)-S-oxide reductase [Marinilactibacillus piezotolerans]
MKPDQETLLNTLYNLILNPATRNFERSILQSAKDTLDDDRNLNRHLAEIEAQLRPLALRNNLTPDVMDFYNQITGNDSTVGSFDFSNHQLESAEYQDSATFAGGCFWCMVEPFEERNGILSVLSGYTGGDFENPNYDQVVGQYTGHVEAVEILFDKRLIEYEELLDIFWKLTDPTDASGQFQDRGEQYRSIIFVKDEEQRLTAERSKLQLEESHTFKQPIVTEIKSAGTFWPAENYHQQFYKKNPKRHKGMWKSHKQFLFFRRLQAKLYYGLKRFRK